MREIIVISTYPRILNFYVPLNIYSLIRPYILIYMTWGRKKI